MRSDVINHVVDIKDQLSKSERLVAELILNDMQFVINNSIVDIAKHANVSTPTVTRFCQSIDIGGLKELKIALSQSMKVGTRFLTQDIPIHNIEDITQNILAKAQQALFEVERQIDLKKITQIIELILKTEQIYAFGSGGISSMLSNEMVNRFFRLQIIIMESSDHEMQKMMAATVKKESLLFLFSVSGYNENLIECARIARQYGAKIVTITRSNTPLSKIADHSIEIDITEGNYVLRPTSSRYAYLALLDIIANGVATQLGNDAINNLRKLKFNQTPEQENSPLGD